MAQPNPRAVTLALGLLEGRRLVWNPLVLVGAELGLYLHVRAVMSGQMPVVPRDDVAIGYALLPLAAATLLVANWATLRSRRHGTTELCDSLPMSPEQRAVAHLLSVLAPAGLAAVAAIVDLLVLLALGGVGTPNPLEVLSGPAVVALAGVLGVLIAYLIPNVAAALVVLVGAAASWYFPWLFFRATGQVRLWHSFWMFPWFQAPGSPSGWGSAFAGGWHLAYVTGLIGVAACLTLAMASERRRPKMVAIVAAVLSLALTRVSVAPQASPFLVTHPAAAARLASGVPETQTCVMRGEVRYCAWPAYLPWVDRWWKPPVAGVLRRVPATQPRRTLTVHQMDLDVVCWYSPACLQRQEVARAFAWGDVHPSSSWPRGIRQGEVELILAASAAAWAMGLPTGPSPDSPSLTICMPAEARVMLALWLAGQSTPKAAAWLRARTFGQPNAGYGASAPQSPGLGNPSRLTLGSDVVSTEWPWQEAAYAVELLDRPADEVASTLQEHWQTWSQPGIPTWEMAEALGLPVSGAAARQGAQSPPGAQVPNDTGCNSGGAGRAQN